MYTKKRERHAPSVAVLCILGVFTVLSLLLIVFGAGAYSKIAARIQTTDAARASLNYAANKLRMNGGSAQVEELPGGGNALVLETELESGAYHTYIYFYEGSLRELFLDASAEFSPGDGDALMELDTFSIEADGEFFRFTAAAPDAVPMELRVRRNGGAA